MVELRAADLGAILDCPNKAIRSAGMGRDHSAIAQVVGAWALQCLHWQIDPAGHPPVDPKNIEAWQPVKYDIVTATPRMALRQAERIAIAARNLINEVFEDKLKIALPDSEVVNEATRLAVPTELKIQLQGGPMIAGRPDLFAKNAAGMPIIIELLTGRNPDWLSVRLLAKLGALALMQQTECKILIFHVPRTREPAPIKAKVYQPSVDACIRIAVDSAALQRHYLAENQRGSRLPFNPGPACRSCALRTANECPATLVKTICEEEIDP